MAAELSEQMSPEEFRAYIEGAVNPYEFEGEDGYDNAARYAAKVLLQVASRSPQEFKAALDAFRQNPYGPEIDSLLTPSELGILMAGKWGITGFQWGWAVNAAAYLTEQPPVPNPAIVRIAMKEAHK